MADDQVVCSHRALSQPVDSEVNCRADRGCMQAHPHEQDHLESNNRSVLTDILHDAKLSERSRYCNAISSGNANKDLSIDVNKVVLKQQSSNAPFGYPPCLPQIMQAAVSVLDNCAAEDCVLHDSISCENASVDKSEVTGGACYNGNSGTRVLKGNCTEHNEKQAQANVSKPKSIIQKNAQDENCSGLKRAKYEQNFISELSIDSVENESNGDCELIESAPANKIMISYAVNCLTSNTSDVSKPLTNGDLEKNKTDVSASELCELSNTRLGALDSAKKEVTHISNEPGSVIVTSSSPCKVNSNQPVATDADSVDTTEWKSVEVRRRKKDVVCKLKDSMAADAKSALLTSRVPVGAVSEGQALRSANTSNRSSLTMKAKSRVEEVPVVTSSSLSLDSLSFPELPLSSNNHAPIGILPQVSESGGDSSDHESAKHRNFSSGQPVNSVADTSSYASIVVGAKSKSLSTTVPVASGSNAAITPVLLCSDEQRYSTHQELLNLSNGVVSLPDPALNVQFCDNLVSIEVASANLQLDAEPSQANDCSEIRHSKKSACAASADCDIVQITEPYSAVVLPCNNYSGCVISFGDVQLCTDDSDTGQSGKNKLFTSTACLGSWASQSTDCGSALPVIPECDTSASIRKTSSSVKPASLFFDTRIKAAATSASYSPVDIVFGFDSSLPVPDCSDELHAVAKACARLSFENSDNLMPSRGFEMQFGNNGQIIVGESAMLNRFDLPLAQAYFITAFNEVMAVRDSQSKVVFYYGVDIN